MIRQKTLSDIRREIESNSKFTTADFIITTKVDKIVIRYEYDNSYYFEAEVPSQTTTINKERRETHMVRTLIDDVSYEDYKFYGKLSPGNLTLVESFNVIGEKKFFKQITEWLNNLWDELIAIPVNRQFENQEKIIQEIKDRLNNIPDTYFEFEEAEEIKRKIDNLELQFQEKLNKEILDKEELKKQLEDLHGEFSNLKATLHSVKRKGWIKSFVTKTFIWVSKEENRKFLKDTKELIIPFLPENIKNVLP